MGESVKILKLHFWPEEIYQYKQDRFGPNGDFILQKKQLIQPIQDQIFLAIREIAKTKKYDFIFAKALST